MLHKVIPILLLQRRPSVVLRRPLLLLCIVPDVVRAMESWENAIIVVIGTKVRVLAGSKVCSTTWAHTTRLCLHLGANFYLKGRDFMIQRFILRILVRIEGLDTILYFRPTLDYLFATTLKLTSCVRYLNLKRLAFVLNALKLLLKALDCVSQTL